MAVEVKLCTSCMRILPISKFSPLYKAKKEKLRNRCKSCEKMIKHNQRKHGFSGLFDYQRPAPDVDMKTLPGVPFSTHRRIRSKCGEVCRMAIKKGQLVIPKHCAVCGTLFTKQRDAVMHHSDYQRPLEVWFLCRSCHVIVHLQAKGAKPAYPRTLFLENGFFGG